MNNHKALLRKLIKTLVDEWGHEEVVGTLATVSATPDKPLLNGSRDRQSRSRKDGRLSAVGQIERAGLQGEYKEALLQLAERYDLKQFLPSVADVREFLIMFGERPVGMKDRSEAFRVLLRSLTQLPIDRLQQLAQTALHSGPSELGPLSDAIAAASQRLPRQTTTDMIY